MLLFTIWLILTGSHSPPKQGWISCAEWSMYGEDSGEGVSGGAAPADSAGRVIIEQAGDPTTYHCSASARGAGLWTGEFTIVRNRQEVFITLPKE